MLSLCWERDFAEANVLSQMVHGNDVSVSLDDVGSNVGSEKTWTVDNDDDDDAIVSTKWEANDVDPKLFGRCWNWKNWKNKRQKIIWSLSVLLLVNCLSICSTVYLRVCPSVYLSVTRLSTYLLPVCVYPSAAYLFFCLLASLSVFNCPSVSRYTCLSVFVRLTF
jgi:hypothetical protein